MGPYLLDELERSLAKQLQDQVCDLVDHLHDCQRLVLLQYLDQQLHYLDYLAPKTTAQLLDDELEAPKISKSKRVERLL